MIVRSFPETEEKSTFNLNQINKVHHKYQDVQNRSGKVFSHTHKDTQNRIILNFFGALNTVINISGSHNTNTQYIGEEQKVNLWEKEYNQSILIT